MSAEKEISGMFLLGEVEGKDEAGQDGGTLKHDQLRVERGRAGPAVRGTGDVVGGRILLNVYHVRVVLGYLQEVGRNGGRWSSGRDEGNQCSVEGVRRIGKTVAASKPISKIRPEERVEEKVGWDVCTPGHGP